MQEAHSSCVDNRVRETDSNTVCDPVAALWWSAGDFSQRRRTQRYLDAAS